MLDSLLWYSRYAVWVGALVLLVQSVTGRSIAIISVVAVLMLAAGFIAFVGALSWAGMLPATHLPTLSQEPLAGRRSETNESVDPASSALRVSDAAEAHASSPVRLAAERLGADSALVGAACAVCGKRLSAGQVTVRCPECGAVQHVSCWTENGFVCAMEGCSGTGSLDAPESG